MRLQKLFLLAFICFLSNVQAQKKTHSGRTEVLSPEQELAGFTVPDGFIVELVASEKEGIVNPIDIKFDDAGRLWTQTAEMYPLDPVANIQWHKLLQLMDNPEAQRKNPNFKRIFDLYEGKTKGKDKILVLSDLYKNKPVKVSVWADGLALPQSILPYKGGSYVAQGSELFYLSDSNNDGKADKRTRLFTGFGITDTHTMAHVLTRAPGDWIHFSHGALNKGNVTSLVSDANMQIDYSKIARISLDAKKAELVSAGLNNIWGFKLRGNGQWYGCEANDIGYSVVPLEDGTGFPGIGSDRIRPYQPWMPQLHKFRVGGTGISGLAFTDDVTGSFPEEWRDVAFLANPITSKINAVKIKRNADGTVTGKHLSDFLVSKDDWFRPINMEFGPDGCLYIVDWYNKIVSHNELPTTHPDRDKSHGRIFRIRHKSQKVREIPNLYKVKTKNLVNHLKSPSIWEKRAAWHQITDRPIKKTKKLAKKLIALASDTTQEEMTRILALWSLEGIRNYNKELLTSLINSPKDNLRREAIRSLASFSLNADQIAALLMNKIGDKNPMVRSQILRTLGECNTANNAIIGILVKACQPDIEGNEMGGSYERKFERYLARKTLEKYPNELQVFTNSSLASAAPKTNLIWATQALPKIQKEQSFLSLLKKANFKKLDESTFIIAAKMLSNPLIYDAVKPLLGNTNNAEYYVKLALKHQSQVQSNELASILEKPVSKLIGSTNTSEVHLGLGAAGRLKINNLRDQIIMLINNDPNAKALNLAMRVLETDPKTNKPVFTKLATNKNLGFDLRVASLNSLAKSDQNSATNILKNWIKKLDVTQLKSLTNKLSNSKQGASVLKKIFSQKLLTIQSFDISSAEKVYNSNKKDKVGQAILKSIKQRMADDKKAFEAKLTKFMKIAEKKNGNPKRGKALFQTCLMCHKVGDKGQDFAPALDGSALRENEALLTAILDPDAALESSYAIFRITKKDDSNIEGYLVKRDNRGTTIGFMGGSKLFIQASDIKSQGFLGGRSFMVKGLIDYYSEKQVSDLLSYIHTLN